MLELKKLTSVDALNKLKEEAASLVSLRHYERKDKEEKHQILICGGTGCTSSGCGAVQKALQASIDAHGLHDKVNIVVTGCHGFCEMGPLGHIEPQGRMYIHVKPEDCHEILEKTVLGGEIIDRLVYKLNGVAYPRQEDIPFYKLQKRVVLENCGTSDAEDIEEYIEKTHKKNTPLQHKREMLLSLKFTKIIHKLK